VNRVKESSRKKSGLPLIRSKTHSDTMVPNTAGREGLMQTQKYELCLLRSCYPNMKLAKFAKLLEYLKRQDERLLGL